MADAFDLVIRNGTILDGTGAEPYEANVAVSQEECVEFGLLRRFVERSERPLSFTLAEQKRAPEGFRGLLRLIGQSQAEGLPIRAQVAPRPIGLLFGHDLSFNPFSALPSYAPLKELPLEEKIAVLGRPEVRRRPLEEEPTDLRYEHMVRRSRDIGGVIVYREGQPTGALPGRLVRPRKQQPLH